MNKFFVGVDIGGTNIRVGAFDKEGTLSRVLVDSSAENLPANITRLISNMPPFEAIGIGVPGMVENNKITTCRNIEFLKDYPLKETLENRFKKPVYLQNDAKLACLGEALTGAGKSYNAVAYIGLGTGLGGGLVIDKKIYGGAGGLAAYFSRVILDGNNIAEHLLSGKAFSRLPLEEYKKHLTNLLLNISITINPDAVILGGGVMRSADLFFEDVVSSFKALAHSAAKDTAIKKAALEYPGVTGAALYAKSLIPPKQG